MKAVLTGSIALSYIIEAANSPEDVRFIVC